MCGCLICRWPVEACREEDSGILPTIITVLLLSVEFKIAFGVGGGGEMSNMQGWAAQPLIPASPTRYPESHVRGRD